MIKKIRIFDPTEDSLNYDFSYNSDETKELHKIFNNKSDMSINDLRRIYLWKLDRVVNISDETILKLNLISTKTDLTIEDDLVKDLIKALVESNGVGYPMASAFLKFIRPDIFPIIDIRAYRALTGKKICYSSYKFELYVDYVKKLMDIAKKYNRPLSEIDEQLYCFDKENNKNI